jgi:hypothetical protein
MPIGANGVEAPFFHKADDVMKRSEGACPAAEHPPEEYRNDDQDKGEIKGYGNGVGGKDSRDEDQGIEIDEESYRITEFVMPLRFRLQEEEQKEQ